MISPVHLSLGHIVFTSGYPSKYWISSTLLTFGNRSGTGISKWCTRKPMQSVPKMIFDKVQFSFLVFQKYKHSFPEDFDLFNIFLNAHMHCKLYSQHSPFEPRRCCIVSSLSARKLAGIPWQRDIWYQMANYRGFFVVISNGIFLFLLDFY